jgi:hypothetical protein
LTTFIGSANVITWFINIRSDPMKQLLCVVALFVPSQVDAASLYIQAPSLPGGYTTWTSGFVDSSMNYYSTLDNFSLSSTSILTGISWQGDYLQFDPSTGNNLNGAPNTTQWRFAIYTAGGTSSFPFTLVTQQIVPASSVTETFAGTTGFFNPGSGTTTIINYYNESVTLSGITLQAKQTYYLGIFSFNNGSGDAWSWTSSNTGDGVSYQYNTFDNATLTRSLDRTFSLSGNVVPEPSSFAMALLGAGILGATYVGRRP